MKSSAFGVGFAALLLLALAHPAGGQQPREFSLRARNGAIAEEFSDAVGMIELRDGRAVVTDRREAAAWIVDFKTGERKRLGRTGPGPNEYGTPFGPFPWRGDTSLIYGGSARSVIRVAPNGTLAGNIPLPAPRMDGVHSFGLLRGVDRQGRVYWDAPIIQMQPTVKRLTKAQIIRWMPGTDTAEVIHEFTDHAEFEDKFRFSPMRQTDAWVVAPDGRIGVLSAAEYRLRWYLDGKLVETGPAIPYTPVAVTAAEREAFWEKKAQEPASGVSMNGGPVATRSMSLERVKTSWPDSIFPKVMPPFELNGAQIRPNGTIWVTRTQPAREKSGRIDILDAHGALSVVLRLPPRTRLFGIGAESVYLLATDDDGLQTLERYALPPEIKR